MSSLTDIEKRYLEKLLGMQSGYVLDYSDATYAEFFSRHRIDIHGARYQTYGTRSKLRAFWEHEPDAVVGKALSELLDSYKAGSDLNGHDLDAALLDQSRAIVARLSEICRRRWGADGEGLLSVSTILNVRSCRSMCMSFRLSRVSTNEARTVLLPLGLFVGDLSCGSVLEASCWAPRNETRRSLIERSRPKYEDGSVKKFHDWSLAQLIETACETGLLKPM